MDNKNSEIHITFINQVTSEIALTGIYKTYEEKITTYSFNPSLILLIFCFLLFLSSSCSLAESTTFYDKSTEFL